MIEFNLLPDVKMEYLKAQEDKRKFVSTSIIVASAAVIIFVVLFLIVNVVQRQQINKLTNEIKQSEATLKSTQDIDKILTIQNQLASLPSLHDKKYVAARLPQYLKQIVPSNVNIAKLDVDFVNSTMKIDGSADSLASVNTFVDTLKFTEYKVGDETKKAFSEVVLASFGRNEAGATYEITLKFDPAIFNSASEVELIVPKTISSRSETEKPTDIFQPLSGEGNQ